MELFPAEIRMSYDYERMVVEIKHAGFEDGGKESRAKK